MDNVDSYGGTMGVYLRKIIKLVKKKNRNDKLNHILK